MEFAMEFLIFNDRIADYSLWKSFAFISLSLIASTLLLIPLMGIGAAVGFQYVNDQASEITDEIHKYLPNHEDNGEVCSLAFCRLLHFEFVSYSATMCCACCTHAAACCACAQQFKCVRLWSIGLWLRLCSMSMLTTLATRQLSPRGDTKSARGG